MNQRSQLDPNHIVQLAFDEKSRANRVKIEDTQFSMELNHEDGDSVTSHPAKLTASVLGVTSEDNGKIIIPALDCSSLREVHVSIEGTGDIHILVSPTDSGDFFYFVGQQDKITNICARRIKIKSIDVVGNVHLVGRS